MITTTRLDPPPRVLPEPEPLLCRLHGQPRIVLVEDGTRAICFRCMVERPREKRNG